MNEKVFKLVFNTLDVGLWFVLFISPILSATLIYSVLNEINSALLIVSSPLIYMVWFIIALSLCAIEMKILGIFFTKPHRLNPFESHESLLKMFALQYGYRRMLMLRSMPLYDFILGLPYSWIGVKKLGLLAYSSKASLGRMSEILTWPQDPDLTTIGDNVTIGSGTTIVSHGISRNVDSQGIYNSAKIEIGSLVTIGGGCQINMGVKIGDGAVIEVGSNLLPFTRVGEGEIWGGNPAKLLRKVSEDSVSENVDAESINTTQNVIEISKEIVADVCKIPLEVLNESSQSKDMSEWDSLACMGIAASIYDKVGVSIPSPETMNLTSITKIAGYISGNEKESYDSLFVEPEFLPLNKIDSLNAALVEAEDLTIDKRKQRILISSSYTTENIKSYLNLWMSRLGLLFETSIQEYNQIQIDLLTDRERETGDIRAVLTRVEDLWVDGDDRKAKAKELLESIRQYTKNKQLIVGNISDIVTTSFVGSLQEARELAFYWNNEITKIDGVIVSDISRAIGGLGKNECLSLESELVTRSPYSMKGFLAIATELARTIRKIYIPPKKVIVLDADNTLWGGVIGEDGISGISISEDYPGSSFSAFQRKISHLAKHGVLIVIASKNEEQDVLDVLDSHAGMVIKRGDIAAHRINWKRKSDNIREIAKELNLGLDSLVFFDDSPMERLEVKSELPEVTVIPMPEKPEQYVDLLDKLWIFDSSMITQEDSIRSSYMIKQNERTTILESSDNVNDYLQALELKASIRNPCDAELGRVAQLTQKTNQFNLTLNRLTLEEVKTINPNQILIMSAQDKFGDYGIIGALTFEAEDESIVLTNFLMSCRALGRKLEELFLYSLVIEAQKLSCSRIVAPFVAGPRNNQVRDFLVESGFSLTDEGRYILSQVHKIQRPKIIKSNLSNEEVA